MRSIIYIFVLLYTIYTYQRECSVAGVAQKSLQMFSLKNKSSCKNYNKIIKVAVSKKKNSAYANEDR